MNSQIAAGNITCTVLAETLNCNKDNYRYSKPSIINIFSYGSGSFTVDATDNNIYKAVMPRLYAALQRATLLLNGGDLQPGLDLSFYYITDSSNLYSKFVHELKLNGKGYAFPYNDVDPWEAD